MYCLDTSVIIELFEGNEQIRKKIERISENALYITPIVLCELYKGAAHAGVMERRLEFIERLLQTVEILEFTEEACRLFGEDCLKLKKSGKPIKDNDLMIAAICKAHNKVFVTTDKKHFENVPNLRLEVW